MGGGRVKNLRKNVNFAKTGWFFHWIKFIFTHFQKILAHMSEWSVNYGAGSDHGGTKKLIPAKKIDDVIMNISIFGYQLLYCIVLYIVIKTYYSALYRGVNHLLTSIHSKVMTD